ncbi:MAG TPA: siderophore biosynthesis protein [Catenuloplanes sp.]
MRIYLTALNPTDSLLDGFLPAAAGLGLPVTVLTDQPTGWPSVTAEVAGCDVRDPRAVIDTIHNGQAPAALLSNSDHLQTPTALAAAYLGLPGKDWRATLRCKDKRLTRRTLADAGLDAVATATIGPTDGVEAAATLPFPAVVKPREGVASEDAYLVADLAELTERVAGIRARRPGTPLVVEEYLAGELRTFDTLGDGTTLTVTGSWHTTLGRPPSFIEESLDWAPALPERAVADLRAQLDALGVGFGACHTEFVLAGDRARLIEVNYRLIGDRMDLILAELLGIPLFEYVLRVHLGEPLAGMPRPEPAAVSRHARVEYVCADTPGTLVAAPGNVDLRVDDTWVGCRPLRRLGVTVPVTGTNRDYLAVLHAIGADPAAVRSALRQFRDGHRWTIGTPA